MFNFNGTIVSKINDVEPELVHALKNSFSIFETVRYQNDKILFWDFHYLRIMASLRRFRFNIPKHFSFEFLETEIIKLIKIMNRKEHKQPLHACVAAAPAHCSLLLGFGLGLRPGALHGPSRLQLRRFLQPQTLPRGQRLWHAVSGLDRRRHDPGSGWECRCTV